MTVRIRLRTKLRKSASNKPHPIKVIRRQADKRYNSPRARLATRREWMERIPLHASLIPTVAFAVEMRLPLRTAAIPNHCDPSVAAAAISRVRNWMREASKRCGQGTAARMKQSGKRSFRAVAQLEQRATMAKARAITKRARL